MIPGIIFCGWGTLDLVQQSLAPWIKLRRKGSCKICAVSVRFAGFKGEDDGTRSYLLKMKERGEIDHLIDGPDDIRETEARGMALTYLVAQNVDAIWLVDSDELYDAESIQRLIEFVDQNPWTDWFRLSLKNYVIDRQTYLAEPFTPPRIFRTHPNGRGNHHPFIFIEDNDIGYKDVSAGPNAPIWHQMSFASQTVPANYVWVPHITWQNDSRARDKFFYQADARGWRKVCSFSWDDSQGGLIFSPALPRPKVAREST